MVKNRSSSNKTFESKGPRSLSSAIELFGKSYEVFKRNLSLFLLLYSIPFLFALWDGLARYSDEAREETRGWGSLLGSSVFGPSTSSSFYNEAGFLLALLAIPFIISQLMVEILNLRAAQGKLPTFKHLWSEFVERWLWLKLIGLMIVATIAILIGLLLLIVPGLILLWRLFLAPYVLIDQKVGIEEALRRSWRMTKGYAWPIYSVLIVTAVLAVIVSVVPLIGAILAAVLSAIYAIAPALRYWEIK